ncbi:MAG: hypothetical protein PHR82_09400, partial [Endomicrobiaceae bacterium]|nr:hypothetical protein [Endomicrobiaceae bacterium]
TNEWEKGLTLDRIDNDSDYCPENCRWTTVKNQCYNRRTNHLLTVCGITKSICQWETFFGFNKGVISKWIYRHNDEYAINKIYKLLREIGVSES